MIEPKWSEQQERNLHIDSAKALKLYAIQIVILTLLNPRTFQILNTYILQKYFS